MTVDTDVPGRITKFVLAPEVSSSLRTITKGSDGNVWFTDFENHSIGRITPSGVVTEYDLGTVRPDNITAGPDGNLWFTEGGSTFIGRITTQGVTTHFDTGFRIISLASGLDGNLWFSDGSGIGKVSTAGVVINVLAAVGYADPIVAGPDGNMWFIDRGLLQIGRIMPTGVVTKFSQGIPPDLWPLELVTGADGNLWFTTLQSDTIFRISPSGIVTGFNSGVNLDAGRNSIISGPDGNIWFTAPNGFGRISPDGLISEFTTGFNSQSSPFGMTTGPDGNLWFTEPNRQIGRFVGPTRVVLTAPSTVPAGTSTNLTLTLTSGAGVPTGNLAITVDNGEPQTVSLVNGVGQFPLNTLGVGTHTIRADYADQGLILGGRSQTMVTVTPTIVPAISINDVVVTEGNAGTSNATFTVSLSASTSQLVSVGYSTADGTATSPSDYTSLAGQVNFNPGETTKTISIPIIGDTDHEANEFFSVKLSAAQGATITRGLGVGTINNDDPAVKSNTAPVATGANVNTNKNTALSGTLTGTDADVGDKLVFGLVSAPLNGIAVVQADGKFTYTPNSGFMGNDAFSFKVNDGTVDSAPATVKISVQAQNSVPVASSASFETAGTPPLNDTLKGMDSDGDTLTFSLVSDPLNGSVSVNPNGDFTYSPNKGFSGNDAFKFKVNDGKADSQAATVSIKVLSAPVTAPQIQLTGTNNSVIANQDTSPSSTDGTDFGTTDINSGTVTRTFTIKNAGTAELKLTGAPVVSFSGTQAGDFSILTAPSTTIAAGATTSFVVTFAPTSAGSRTATVTIASNDASRSPFTFLVQGTGTAAPQAALVQRIAPQPSTQEVAVGQPVNIVARYQTVNSSGQPVNKPSDGLRLLVHYNSKALQFEELAGLTTQGGPIVGTPQDETTDTADAGATTDKFVQVIFSSNAIDFPGQQPLDLFTARFTALTGLTSSTRVNFTATPGLSDPTTEFGFDATSATVNLGVAVNPDNKAQITTTSGTTTIAKKATLVDPGIAITVNGIAAGGFANVNLQVIARQVQTGETSTKDTLSLLAQGKQAGQLNLFKSTQVRIGTEVIGKLSGGTRGKPLVVTFNDKATQATVEQVLRQVAFRSTLKGPRRVQFQLTGLPTGDSEPTFKNVTV